MRYLHYASLIATEDKRLPAPRVPVAARARNHGAAGVRKPGYARSASAGPARHAAPAKSCAIVPPLPPEPARRLSSANLARKLNTARRISLAARPGFLAA